MAITNCKDPEITDMIRVQNPINGAWYRFVLFGNGMIHSFREGERIGGYSAYITDISWFLPIDDLADWGKIMARSAQLAGITRVERCTYPKGVDDRPRGFERRYLCRWPDNIDTPEQTYQNTSMDVENSADDDLPGDAWTVFFEEWGNEDANT